MNVILFNYKKRQNSTARPNPSTGHQIDCQLKDETSFLNPVLKISPDIVSGVFSPAAFNYVQIPYWQRYYFITDWEYLNGIWEARLTADPLASFKTEIGNTSAYVIRSDNQFNGKLIDGRYPITTNTSVISKNLSQMFNINEGCFVVGCLCNENTVYRQGTVAYYAMTRSELNTFLNFLYSDSIFTLSNITSIEEGLYKAISNPSQYIVSCMWVPVSINIITDRPLANMSIGYWQDVPVQARLVPAGCFGFSNHVELPTHPQASRGEYLNYTPYTKHTLYFPPFGGIPIETSYKNFGKYINAYVSVDVYTGQGNLRVCISDTSGYTPMTDQKIITERTGICGVPIQISASGTNFFAGLTGAVSAGINVAAGNYAGAASGLVSTASGLIEQNPTSIGYNGSFLETFEQPMLVTEFFRIADEDRSEFGRPLCAVRKLATLPGYIQCGEDDHAFSGTASENEQINQHLKNGFFFE